jgi:hypothetical protein
MTQELDLAQEAVDDAIEDLAEAARLSAITGSGRAGLEEALGAFDRAAARYSSALAAEDR